MPSTQIANLDVKDDNVDQSDRDTCRICRRQVSRYTCPSCNIPYCSLACFRSENHEQCSEAFYKRELESEIKTKPSASHEERRQMMMMLQKFEQEDDGPLNDFVEGDSALSLAHRLAEIDLESVPPSQLWEVLTPEERESFMKTIENPSSASLQMLLQSEVLEKEIQPPWWEARQPNSVTIEKDLEHEITPPFRCTKKPDLISIPGPLLRRPPGPDTGPPLLYNICAVLVAYSYIIRHLAKTCLSSIQPTDEDDVATARQLFRSLTPFLSDKNSKILLASMDEMSMDLWSKVVDSGKASRESFPLLLRDAAFLLAPKRVIELGEPAEQLTTPYSQNSDLSTHPHIESLCAFSDMYQFYQTLHTSKHSCNKSKDTPTTHRLRFYMAYIALLPTPILASFASEVTSRALRIESEIRDTKVNGNKSAAGPKGRIIEERQKDTLTLRPVGEEI